MASAYFLLSLVFFALFLSSSYGDAQDVPPIAKGLSWDFYKKTCPKLESIVRSELKKALKKDIGQAAGLLRIHFHDCFVQGCDGSVLLDGSASGPGEKEAPPNLTLRKESFRLINAIRDLLEKACGRVVSCSDIAALAARDAVFLSGGPDYEIPLGRRDGLKFATQGETLANLPPPSDSAASILERLKSKNLDPTDVVALSGGHTIGIAHCTSFTDRLFPNQDNSMDKFFASQLRLTCPKIDTDNSTNLDIRTPNVFDNKYYIDLMNRQGLFTSDQDLYSNPTTKPIVKSFALDQELFFEKFIVAMNKMGQLGVLTGNQGEIRANCSARNPTRVPLSSIIAGEEGENAAL